MEKGLWCVEMPFPRGREKVERSDFSRVCLLKGVDVSDEISGQQVLSKKGGRDFPSTMCWGCVALHPWLLCLPGPKWAHKRATEKTPLWSNY